VTENAIGTERGRESEIGHANLLGTTTPNPPAIRLRGVTRKLEEPPRRPSGDGPTRYGIRAECTHHRPNIPWNTQESPRGNRKPRLLPRLPGGRSRRRQTPI